MKSTKAKARDFTVPLSPEAVEVVKFAMQLVDVNNADAILVSGKAGKPISDMTMAKVLKTAKVDATDHGFRSSFRDWTTEGGHDWVTAEMCLSHAVGGSVQQVYARSANLKNRSHLMNAWADHLVPLMIEDHSRLAAE